jgi:transposase
MAHIKLSHSRAFLLRAYPLQTHEMLFDAHWHAFRVFGGVPGRGIYDNMKTAVDRVGRGKERQINMRFLAMTNHYVYEPEFCNPAAGWEKGQVEKNVRDSRHQMLQGMPEFPDLAALNAWLEQRCLELWRQSPHGKQPGSIALHANKSETFDCLKFTLEGSGERSDGNARTSAHALACRA